MKRVTLFVLSLLLLFAFSPIVDAHSGRTDGRGGHNCTEKSIAKGLCTGYHYHNGGVSSPPTTTQAPKTAPVVQSPPIKIIVNGQTQTYSQSPLMVNGTTLVPMRGIFESLGATVDWNSQSKKITGKRNNTSVTLTVGTKQASVNDKPVALTESARVVNGSTLVPLRFIGEALSASVQWDSSSRTITIISK